MEATSLKLRTTCLAVLTVTAAACSAPAPPPAPVQPAVAEPPSENAIQLVDGTYHALGVLIRGNPYNCGNRTQMTFRVKENAFLFVLNQPQVPWRRTVRFNVTVDPDGSFETVVNTAAIRGRIQDGHMSGELIGDACAFAFEADRGDSW